MGLTRILGRYRGFVEETTFEFSLLSMTPPTYPYVETRENTGGVSGPAVAGDAYGHMPV